jgi:hypothetical protein
MADRGRRIRPTCGVRGDANLFSSPAVTPRRCLRAQWPEPIFSKGSSMTSDVFDRCIAACNACAQACAHCASSCLREKDVTPMAACIALDADCEAMCRLAASLMGRHSPQAHAVCALCADMCSACADECGKHSHAHCQACATACRNCAQECRGMATATA